ncbi:MAG: biotin--[acetyl-CoA-carboxylase] ligase [Ignavibacterium sp.]|uniref:biotin--[acetyl-CoA-carboxylase] ligase n=1 Tax=Ignavibacterium sp. TaxID=2651167 RepID=UPI004048F46E
MFDIENFDIKLNTDFIGRNFIYIEEIDSTNTFLLDRKNGVDISGTVVLAEKQTKGRGRKNRVWYSSKEQNLTFSILLFKEYKLFHHLNLINFCASLSVASSIENLYQLKTELKWPNDVLINKKKTCGILLESSSQGNKIDRVVVGIGVNVNQSMFQGQFNYPPTSIRIELGKEVEREKLLAEILNNFEFYLSKILNEPEYITREWKEKCKILGEKVYIKEGETVKNGIFEDIDKEGFLLLRTKEGIEKITIGDVSLI